MQGLECTLLLLELEILSALHKLLRLERLLLLNLELLIRLELQLLSVLLKLLRLERLLLLGLELLINLELRLLLSALL